MSTLYVDLTAPRTAPPKAPAGRMWSNAQRRSTKAFPGEGGAPLSNEQKARLCIMAQRAFAEIHGPATPGVSAAAIEAWRRAEQQRAVGKSSLTTCTQADYNALLAHFAEMAGETGTAYTAHVKDATAPRRIALRKLQTECEKRGLTLAYPTTICRSKYKCALDDATPAQLWKLVFDVRKSKHPVLPKQGGKPSAGPLPAKLTFTKTGTKPPVAAENIPF